MALLLTVSFESLSVEIKRSLMPLFATSLSITVACLIRRPTIEHTLILIIWLFMFFNMWANRIKKALLINRFATFELVMMDSK